MKHKEITLVLIGAYLIAALANFEGFFWRDYPDNELQILTTASYAVVSVWYLLYT